MFKYFDSFVMLFAVTVALLVLLVAVFENEEFFWLKIFIVTF